MPSTASARLFGLVVFLMVVLGGMVVSVPDASAAGVPRDCPGVVANGSFESPAIGGNSSLVETPDGWNENVVLVSAPGSAWDGSQYASLYESIHLSQTLTTTGLTAGDTITISLVYEHSIVITLGTETVTTPYVGGVWIPATISYTLQTDAEAVTLTIGHAAGIPFVDAVTASCTSPEPVVADDQSIIVPYEGTFDGTLTASGGLGTFTFATDTAPTKGDVSIEPDGSFTYTANDGESGGDTFTFTATDPEFPELTATGTVTVVIEAPDAVTALPLAFPIDAGAVVSGNLATQVSGGDPPYTFVVATNPSQGSVTIEPDGSFAYTANPDASGTDSFTYTVSDDQATPASATGTVTITITAADAVTAHDQSIAVAYQGATDGTLIATGGNGTYTFAVSAAPARGTVVIDPDGSFTYTADLGQSGSDSFTFTATDTVVPALSGTGTVTVTISAAPDSIPDTTIQVTADPRFAITGSAAIPGEPGLTYALETAPTIGTVVVDPDGSFTYTVPATMATGDSFTVLATALGGETALVTVIVSFEVDSSVPTTGTVKPGGSTGGGGNPVDARDGDPSEPQPTPVPADDDDDDDDGRVQRP